MNLSATFRNKFALPVFIFVWVKRLVILPASTIGCSFTPKNLSSSANYTYSKPTLFSDLISEPIPYADSPTISINNILSPRLASVS
jgi:hypothetical protein